MSGSKLWTWIAVASCAAASCNQPPAPEQQKPPLVTTKQFVMNVAPVREVGESCSTGGPRECKRELVCLHLDPRPTHGWFCSKTCASQADCPRGDEGEWRCVQYLADERACVPPPAWVARAVAGEVD